MAWEGTGDPTQLEVTAAMRGLSGKPQACVGFCTALGSWVLPQSGSVVEGFTPLVHPMDHAWGAQHGQGAGACPLSAATVTQQGHRHQEPSCWPGTAVGLCQGAWGHGQGWADGGSAALRRAGEEGEQGKARGGDAPRVPMDTCSPCVHLPCQQLCSVPIPREAPPVLAVGVPRHIPAAGHVLWAGTCSRKAVRGSTVGFATGPGAHPRGNNTPRWWKPSVRFPAVGQMEKDTCFV